MKNKSGQPVLRTAFYLAFAGLALLALGLFRTQRAYLTRGMPDDFPRSIRDGGAQLGINVQLWNLEDEALAESLASIRAAGFQVVKQPFYFAPVDNYDWANTDRIMAAVDAHGLAIVPLLDGDPAADFAAPSDPKTFASWAGTLADRYRDQLQYYIIWDEPNLAAHWGNSPPNPAEYGALLSATAAAIRDADPDSRIVAAPLAPTIETGPENLSEILFLQQLYAAGVADAFDVVAGKPYGFDTGPDDRRVNIGTLNFSRAILLEELLAQQGEAEKAVWAGNFGWNSLPDSWSGNPSVWGQTDEITQGKHTVAAWDRARREWPWMGLMFLENWQPDAPPNDASWGFSIAGRPAIDAIADAFSQEENLAFPGFHLAALAGPGQEYRGSWRFSPSYGADISQTGDQVSYRFWGTDVALRVRRADYRARLYVTVDGEPANALPQDGDGAALVLGAGDPGEDLLTVEPVAHNLSPGAHTLTVTAWRGWDQWALNGFSNFEYPSDNTYRLVQSALLLVLFSALVLAIRSARRVSWLETDGWLRRLGQRGDNLAGIALTITAGAIVALTGWLTWGAQLDGMYRRVGDLGQLGLTAAAAALFYVTPSFFLLTVALFVFFLLVYARPAWGLVIIAFSLPFYVLSKPMLGYRFSPVEVFLLSTFVATVLRLGLDALRKRTLENSELQLRQHIGSLLTTIWRVRGKPDLAVAALLLVATVSLFSSKRLDVATNEWRVVIVEPVLFYLLLRMQRLQAKELWAIVDAFVLGGLAVALFGLWQYAFGDNVITVAGGLARLRSIYGSPNNVALYLGRILPFLVAMALMGTAYRRRRVLYTLALFPIALALLLTFSKGALFLGVPLSLLIVFFLWRYVSGGRILPWLLAFVSIVVIMILLATSVPAIANRLSLQSATSILRINLWRASITMFLENPFLGVGLDNFLYAYRERYILDAAWEEPSLSHPHNIFLDFATRLGLAGLIVGVWLFFAWGMNLLDLIQHKLRDRAWSAWRPLLVGLVAAFGQTIGHGLVDHSFFLVDLSFAFFLFLAITLWLANPNQT